MMSVMVTGGALSTEGDLYVNRILMDSSEEQRANVQCASLFDLHFKYNHVVIDHKNLCHKLLSCVMHGG